MNRLVRRILGVMLLAVAIYGALVLWRGVGSVAHSFESYAWETFAIACGLAFSNYLLRFLKWEYYLAALGIRGIPKGESLLTFLSGFVLTVTPGKVGEVFKSLILLQTRNIPIARSAPIVVAERVTDLIGVIALIALGSMAFPGGLIWASAGTAVVVLLLVFVSWRSASRTVLGLVPKLPGALGRVGARVAPKVDQLLEGVRELTSLRRLVLPTLISVVAWSLEGIALWVILTGFGTPPPVALAAFFYATATLAGALVPVPGGLGVTEKLLEEQLSRLGGVESATATSAMLLVRFATLWFAVAVGFVALGLLRLRHPALAANAEPGDTKAPSPAPCGTKDSIQSE